MLLKTVFREIRRSLGRYLAIFAIVALGVGFLNGLRVTKAAMLKTLNEYATQSNMFDYEMLSTLGFTQSDVNAFAALSGVRDAVGSYSADFIYVNKDGGDSVLKAHSLTDGVNVPELVAGRMPQSAGECVADANRFSESDVGRTIVLSDSNSSDTMKQFAFRQYRIVGIVKSVTYINFERGSTSLANGVVSGFVYLLPSGFQMSAYTDIYVTLENGGYVYSQEYDDNSAAMETPLKDLAAGMSGVPDDVGRIAAGLPYRDFVTVGLLLRRLQLKNTTGIPTLGNIVPDCWIYVQDTGVKLGRIQISNNWSPYLVADPDRTVWIGLEYFCTEGDRWWNMTPEQWKDFGAQELVRMGVIGDAAEVLDFHCEKVKKAYPAYFDTYDRIDTLIGWLNGFDNLYCVGRNGQHRYNNMDHSVLTGLLAADSIIGASADKERLWNVNAEDDYLEGQ